MGDAQHLFDIYTMASHVIVSTDNNEGDYMLQR